MNDEKGERKLETSGIVKEERLLITLLDHHGESEWVEVSIRLPI